MRRRYSAHSLGLVLVLVLFALTASVRAEAIFVMSDFRTIQEAIDAASPGDVVCVGSGTFNESLVLKEGVSLLGSGSDLTTIDAGADAVGIVAASGCRIDGFFINEGIIGIDCNGASDVKITNNRIYTRYIGVRSLNASPLIEGNSIDATYVAIMTKFSGAPTIRNNELTGRYIGILADDTSPLIHNNRVADFEQCIYTIGSSASILNNLAINSLYDNLVFTRESSCYVINNTIIGSMERGVSIFDSSPVLLNNIITGNDTGLYGLDASPTFSYNCVAGNRETDFDGVVSGATDMFERPLLVGIGKVSEITGINDDTLVCNDAHWVEDSLVGLDLVPNMEKMYIIYGGQDRVFKVISNTSTRIEVEVNVDVPEDSDTYKTLIWHGRQDQYIPGESDPYTHPGDVFFVDDVSFQTTEAGWSANSPCIDAGDPSPAYNDPDGSRNDTGIAGGPYGGAAGLHGGPMVSLQSFEQVYEPGETVSIQAVLTNDLLVSMEVDLHIVVLLEGLPTLFSYPNWTPGFNAVPYTLSARHSEMIPVLTMSASALPQCDYSFMAAFAKRGTLELVSPIDELWVSVRPE